MIWYIVIIYKLIKNLKIPVKNLKITKKKFKFKRNK